MDSKIKLIPLSLVYQIMDKAIGGIILIYVSTFWVRISLLNNTHAETHGIIRQVSAERRFAEIYGIILVCFG
jgi:hypothetical protein